IAPDLHVGIFASAVYQAAVRQHAAKIASAKNAGIAALRIGEKRGFSEIGPTPVPRREVATPYRDFTDLVQASRFAIGVEQKDFPIFQWIADGHEALEYRRFPAHEIDTGTAYLCHCQHIDQQTTVRKNIS